jgi:hypothetical protein
MKPLCTVALLVFSTILTFTPRLFVSRVIAVSAPIPAVTTTLSGKNWAYTVPFAVKNKADIEKLIQCESSGVNISRPDSDGIFSDGILQFHRGPKDTMQSSTWQFFSEASGIGGNPLIPSDAIQLADWAISHGLGPHWSCWRIEKL